MKAVGIVVEYNPFHNGHLYHAKMAREQTDSDLVIAVMSASFLQRGEPALVSKWHRTKMALAGGVDLVVELPYLYSTQKAELFAEGAVSILAAMGADSINFGSESGNIDAFKRLVHIMESQRPLFDSFVKEAMNLGLSYPKATSEAFKQLELDSSVLSLQEPNNILGYHYVKAIHEGHYELQATTTLRRQAHFHDEDLPKASIASATSIRKALEKKQQLQDLSHVMPAASSELIREYVETFSLLHTWEQYFPLLQYKLLSTSLKELSLIYECEEGLQYRAVEMMKTATSFLDWMEKMKTKRYTWTRLQRFATHLLTNTTKKEVKLALSKKTPDYIRLLGMTKRGQTFLNKTRKDREVPLLTKVANLKSITAKIEERATNVYCAPLSPKARVLQMKQEFSGAPIRLH